MRERRRRWWRDQGSQRKRLLHAWMRWDKHSDMLSHAMCAKNECDSRNRTKTKKTNNYAHIHGFTKCVTSLLGFMCFVMMFLWILVFTLSLLSDVLPFNKKVLYFNFISPHIRNSNCNILSSGCCNRVIFDKRYHWSFKRHSVPPSYGVFQSNKTSWMFCR